MHISILPFACTAVEALEGNNLHHQEADRQDSKADLAW